MRTWKWFLVAAVPCLAACNQTVGQCWIDEEGNTGGPGQGAGGGPVVPYGGAGGLGDDVKPQDAAGPQDPPECNSIGSYSASDFKFKTTQQDDPNSPAGGWQEATSTLKFVDGRQDPPAAWTCTLNIGMPLRTVKLGTISAEWAAETTADVATATSSPVMHSKDSWTAAAFCKTLKDTMNTVFGKGYEGLGARVEVVGSGS